MFRRVLCCCLVFACSAVDSYNDNYYSSVQTKDDKLCKVITKTDESYACKPIDQCPAVLRDAENLVSYPKICRFRGRTPIVCCPTSRKTSGQNAAEKCREYYSLTTSGGGTIDSAGGCHVKTVSTRFESNLLTIVGGTPTGESEFPHMVVLGFGEHIKNVQWSCGGSLVSDRYVLSAAHCSETKKRGKVKWALMGDNDMGSDDGAADPQIREVVQRILHPNYEPPSVYNDIGLFRLDAPVQFNRFVLPVCLNAGAPLDAEQAIAIGWGRTGTAEPTSNILMKVTLDLVEQNECNSSYASPNSKRLASGINPNSQLCAGKKEGGKDTCQGDSGGPLQIAHPEFECMYSQVGITSFGKICGEPNAPGVYTRVSNYITWIESIVWP